MTQILRQSVKQLLQRYRHRRTRSIVPSIRLSKETEVTRFVLWELSKECLEEGPDIGRSSDRRSHGICAIRETDTDGLVHIEHVGELIEAIWVQ